VRLDAYALETATLLNQDRSAAIRRRTRVATDVSAIARTVRSSVTGRIVRLPDDVAVEALLAARCDQRPAGTTIDFLASGRSARNDSDDATGPGLPDSRQLAHRRYRGCRSQCPVSAAARSPASR
jgi:hypothetical protein